MNRVVLAALLSGCWRSSPPPVQPTVETKPTPTPVRASAPRHKSDFDEMLEAMEGFADRFCDCRDAQCAQEVSDDMTRWSREKYARGAEAPKMTDEELRRVTAVAERMGQCMQNAMSPPSP